MNHRILHISLFLFFVLLFQALTAQYPDWDSWHSPGYFTSLTTDNSGNIWGSNQGILFRYNLNTQKTDLFHHANSGLPADDITKILWHKGKLYACSKSMGLAVYDGDQWQNYQVDNSDIPSNEVSCVIADQNDHIWVGTNQGVSKFDGHTWTSWTSGNSALRLGYLSDLETDQNGHIWAVSSQFEGAMRFDGNNWQEELRYYNGMPVRFSDIALAPDGKIWLSTTNAQMFRQGSNGWESMYPKSSLNCFQIAFSADGTAWAATDAGLMTKSPSGNWYTYTPQNSGLSSKIVSSIALNSDGTIYAGGNYDKISGLKGSVWTQANLPGNNILPTQIHDITTDNKGDLTIIKGFSNQFVRFDGSGWSIDTMPDVNAKPTYVNKGAYSGDYLHWHGANNFGILKGKILKSISPSYSSPGAFFSNISPVDSQSCWLSSYIGLFRHADNVTTIFRSHNSPIPSENLIHVEGVSKEEAWMIGRPVGGNSDSDYFLGHIDHGNWEFIPIENRPFREEINSLAYAPTGEIWVSSPTSVYRLSGSTWTHWDETNSVLKGLFINKVKISPEGKVWILTTAGAFALKNGFFYQFHPANSGLGQINPQDIEFGKNDETWFQFNYGIYRFKAKDFWEETSNSDLPATLTAYPNPFDQETSLKLTLYANQDLSLVIFDDQGKQIHSLAEGNHRIGVYDFNLQGLNMKPGLYFVVFQSGKTRLSQRLLKVR
ncbi:MAG: T9SS type A sorting domain-containing protein [Bacteroidia bacterium]|nr:T9SS type A sorting domain-containing protein [Bacteroidia bacterium]